jgi:hypothetical protein
MPLSYEDHNNALNEIIGAIHDENVNIVSVVASIASKYGSSEGNKKDEKQDNREKIRKSILKTKTKTKTKSNKKDESMTDKKENEEEKRIDCDDANVNKKKEELSIKNYKTLLSVKYKMDELKKLCGKYKVSKAGNKDELTRRLYEYCENSVNPLKIQKVFRGHLYRKLHKIQGPALMDRDICTNDSDFFTMDSMSEIPVNQFYSYKDNDGFVYGFNIVSLHNLLLKEGSKASNPYNRNEFDNKLKENVSRMVKISRILKIPIEIEIKNEIMDPAKRMELKILELFQTMNSYGNYANSDWFIDLSKGQHIRFARELVDIWNYRALLTNTKKQEICPPHGTPFLGTPYFANVVNNMSLNNISNETIVKYNVQIIENLIKSAVDIDNKMLGTFYVLSALTLVSQPAREAMPWLYEAVVYIP